MAQIQKYILENRRDFKKGLRKTIQSPLQEFHQKFKKIIRKFSKNISDIFFNKKVLVSIFIALSCFISFKDFAWADLPTGAPAGSQFLSPVQYSPTAQPVPTVGPTIAAAATNGSADDNVNMANAGSEIQSTQASSSLNDSVDLLNGLISVVAFVAHPAVMLVGWLLSPDWSSGDIIGLRGVFHSIWTMVANFVYVVFALMLVAIAFMNIFGDSKGQFAMKQALPRLIVGILIVPFTWFIVSATLTFTNILTASVMSLAYDSIKGGVTGNILNEKVMTQPLFSKKMYIDTTDDSDYATGSDAGGGGNSNPEDLSTQTGAHAEYLRVMKEDEGYNYDCSQKGANPDNCVTLGNILQGSNGAYNLMTYYAYGIFKIDKLKELSDTETKTSIKKVSDIFKKLTFGLVFALVFAILVIAIIFALFSRMTMLWIFTMFSPLFALDYFLNGKGLGKIGADLKKYVSITKFISLAMVPVYVGAALAFGLVFLSFAMNSTFSSSSGVDIAKVDEATGDQTITFGKGKTSEMDLTIIGNYNSDEGVFSGVMDAGKGMITRVIISLLALVILWMAVMAALSADEITKAAVEPIAAFGKSVGKLAVDSPKYMPLPVGGGKKMNMEGLKAFGQNIETSISGAASESGRKMGASFGDSIANSLGYTTDDHAKKVRALNLEAAKAKAGSFDERAKYIEKNFKESGLDAKGFAGNDQARNAFAENMEAMGINKEFVDRIKTAKTEDAFAKVLGDIDKDASISNSKIFGSNKSSAHIIESLKGYSSGGDTKGSSTITSSVEGKKDKTGKDYHELKLSRDGLSESIDVPENGEIEINAHSKKIFIDLYKGLYEKEDELSKAIIKDSKDKIITKSAEEMAKAIIKEIKVEPSKP